VESSSTRALVPAAAPAAVMVQDGAGARPDAAVVTLHPLSDTVIHLFP
jgi:hypothetical protein